MTVCTFEACNDQKHAKTLGFRNYTIRAAPRGAFERFRTLCEHFCTMPQETPQPLEPYLLKREPSATHSAKPATKTISPEKHPLSCFCCKSLVSLHVTCCALQS